MTDQTNTTNQLLAEVAALRQSEELFRQVFELAPIGMALTSLEGQFLQINQALSNTLGYAPEELLGHHFLEISHPEDVQANLALRDQVLAGDKPSFQMEKRFITRSGRIIAALLQVTLVRDAHGQPLYFIGQLVDITTRKQMEQLLQHRLAMEELVTAISTHFINNTLEQIDDKIRDTLHAVGEFAGADRCYLGLLNDEETNILSGYEWRNPALEPQVQKMIGQSVAPFTWLFNQLRQAEIVHLPNLDNLPPEAQAERERWQSCNIQSILAVPLILNQALAGFLGLSLEGTSRLVAWSAEDISLLKLVGEVFVNLLARRRAEEALAHEQYLLRTLIDNSPDHIYFKDAASRFIGINQALVSWLGLRDAAQAIGKSDFDFFTTEHAQAAVADEQRIIRTGQPLIGKEEEETWLNGNRTWVSTTKGPLRDQAGNIIGTFGISRDVTEQVQAREALRRYARRLQILHQVDRDVLAARSPAMIAQVALSHIQQLIPCQQVRVVLFDFDTHRATTLAVAFQGDIPREPDLPTSLEGYNLAHLTQGRSHLIEDIATLAQPSYLMQALAAEGIRAYVTVPLMVQDELIGALNLGASQPAAFGPTHLDIAQEVATSLAVAIQQARLYEQTRQDAQTRALLLQEINHRVKNNLAAIIGLIHLEQHRADPGNQPADYMEALKSLINRIRGLATVHRLLSETAWGPLPLSELAAQIIDAALQSLPYGKHAIVDVAPSSIEIISRQANSLALIINELATNTAKYGLGERATVHISVRIRLEANKVLMEYQDDGPGYLQEVLRQKRSNVGLNLVRTLVRNDLRGEVVFYNDSGAVAALHFPKQV